MSHLRGMDLALKENVRMYVCVCVQHMASKFGTNTPMKRAGQPSEVAPAYVFLASDVDSSYITGQVMHPNGGTSECHRSHHMQSQNTLSIVQSPCLGTGIYVYLNTYCPNVANVCIVHQS